MKNLILILISLVLSACSHSVLVKQCKQVTDDEKFVCKTVLPWK